MANVRPSNRYTDYEELFGNNDASQSSSEPSLGRKILEGIGGGAIGAAQGLSDMGANIADFPGYVYEKLTGNEPYHAPRPNFRGYVPSSAAGQGGELIGEYTAPFASPGVALETLLAKSLGLIPRIGLGALTGAAQSENRGLGAALGSLYPGAGKALRTPMTKKSALKRLSKSQELADKAEPIDFKISNDLLGDIEHQFGSKLLEPSRRGIESSLADVLGGGYRPYFKLQSDLGTIGRELQFPENMPGIKKLLFPPQTTAAERLTGREVDALKRRLQQEMSSHLESKGLKGISDLEEGGRQDFSDYQRFKKLRNRALLGILGVTTGYGGIKHFL